MRDGNDVQSAIDAVRDEAADGVGRRRFLRALVGAGVGVGAALSLDPEDFLATDATQVPIVYGFARTTFDDPRSIEPRIKHVPAEWYALVRTALEVSQHIQDTVSGTIRTAVRPAAYGDTPTMLADVTTGSTREEVLGALDGIDGDVLADVAVDLDVIDRLLPGPSGDSGDEGGIDLRTIPPPTDGHVPGGVACGIDDRAASLAPAMYDADHRAFLATANHLYGERGTDRFSHRDEPLYLLSADDRAPIGTVAEGYPAADVVRVEPTGAAPESAIYGAEPAAEVIGQFTEIGLADLQARGESLEMIGARTEHQSGEIDGVGGVTSFYGSVPKRGQLKWGGSVTMADGDSGSVNYHPDPENPDEYVMIGGFNNARTWWPGDDYTWGTAAYRLRNQYGYHF